MAETDSRTEKLCPMTEAHLPQVAELERLCFSEPWSENSLRLLLGEHALGIVAVCDGTVAAYGGMTLAADEGAVTNIAVHPSFRRRGLGRAVTEQLLQAARERGAQRVFLEVRQSNCPARELYGRAGFAVCGERKNFYSRPTESAVLMVWTNTETEEKED